MESSPGPTLNIEQEFEKRKLFDTIEKADPEQLRGLTKELVVLMLGQTNTFKQVLKM